MGTSVLHIKTEVECHVYLFDEEKGIAKPGTWFNLEVRKGEQDLLFVSTEDESVIFFKSYNVEEGDCDYRMFLEQSEFINVNTSATDEEIAEGMVDAYGVAYSRDGKQLLECQDSMIRDYHVRDGCQVIRMAAFEVRCLTSITLPNGLKHIGNEAFSGCNKLTSIRLPNGLKHIGNEAFCGCSNFTAISLPESLTHIGDMAFIHCYNLTAITLPASLTHIGNEAFYDCEKLTTITLPTILTHIGNMAFSETGIRNVISHSLHFTFRNGCLIDKRNNKLLAFLSDQEQAILPNGLTHIGDNAFCGCNKLSAITLPDGLTHIGNGAFELCSNLTAITLSEGLTHIGDRAFYDCEELSAITLPASLTHIGDSAFWLCEKLTTITLPANLTHIGNNAFGLCKSIYGISLPASLTNIGNEAFYYCENLTTIYIPQGFREHFKALLPANLHSKLKEVGPEDEIEELLNHILNDSDGSDEYGSHYGEYAGTYAQDYAGYSDDVIDDAFEGDPDAYWNID